MESYKPPSQSLTRVSISRKSREEMTHIFLSRARELYFHFSHRPEEVKLKGSPFLLHEYHRIMNITASIKELSIDHNSTLHDVKNTSYNSILMDEIIQMAIKRISISIA